MSIVILLGLFGAAVSAIKWQIAILDNDGK